MICILFNLYPKTENRRPLAQSTKPDRLAVSARARRAFTLVEPLAVIAIIAVLAALGFAGLSQAKVTADIVLCSGNLREIGLALHLYLADGSSYPLQTDQDLRGPIYNWTEYLDPYTGTKWPSDFDLRAEREPVLPEACDKANLYVCPGYRKIRGWFERTVPCGAYAYNTTGTGGTGLGGLRAGLGKDPAKYAPVRESMVVSPSEMYVFGDAALWYNPAAGDRGWTVFGNASDLGFNTSYYWNGDKAQKVELDLVNRRHAGRFVVLSADGHTENLKRTEFLDIRNPERLRRFSRDNIAHRENLMW